MFLVSSMSFFFDAKTPIQNRQAFEEGGKSGFWRIVMFTRWDT